MSFRTPSGQTGHDAYTFESAAIANAQRELDERFMALLTAAHAEHPEMFEHKTDYWPDWNGQASNAPCFSDYLRRVRPRVAS